MKISYSRASSYLDCPYKHYLAYVIGLKSKKPQRPLFFGTDFHKCLELRNKPKKLKAAKKDIEEKYYDLKPSYQAELGEDYLEDLFCIFDDYVEIYKDFPQPTQTEQEFEIPIGKFKGEPVYFKGIIDELYKRRNKRTGEKYVKLGEHKTFTRKPDMNTLVMNVQKCLYAKAVYFLTGELPKSVIWDYIHSQPAALPIWLEKTNRLSEAMRKDITPYSWQRACELYGITDQKTIAKGSKYACNTQEFFFRCELDIIPTMVDQIWDGFLYTCKEIVIRGHKNKTRNITRNCGYCTFRNICYSELTGGDTDYLIKKDFIIEPRDDIINTGEEVV